MNGLVIFFAIQNILYGAMDSILIKKLVVGPLQANCYLVSDAATRETAIVDPGGDAREIVRCMESGGLKPVLIVNTHAHPDHVAANAELKKRYEIPILIHKDDAPALAQSGMLSRLIGLFLEPSPPPDKLLRDGDEIKVGKITLKVVHTPGHSKGSICLWCKGQGDEAPLIFSGDTVFQDSVGRTDLPGGSYEALMNSIKTKVIKLPDRTRILPGHGPETTVGREKKYNPFFNVSHRE
jgi:glyoxylase-like metal-dependent hydrolase (beta-lactamase superfamily II)